MARRQVSLEKQIYGKVTYPTIVDTEFSELVSVDPVEQIEDPISVEQFFEEYDRLFYEIPKKGSITSHEAIVKKSSSYVGLTTQGPEIQALLDEINDLRIRLLESQQEIVNLSTNT
jgi:hypothetical protein